MRLILALVAAAAVIALAGCGGGGDNSAAPAATSSPEDTPEGSLEQTLRNMVFRQDQLPEGLAFEREQFTTNELIAEASRNPDRRADLLGQWGRLLGYEATHQRDDDAGTDSPVRGINVSASLYETAAGAEKSFADAAQEAEETDWRANYAGLRKFRRKLIERPEAADEIVWLRFSGFQTAARGADELVIDDVIFFRVDRERGFLRVQSGRAGSTDRQARLETVEGWLDTMIENVRQELSRLDGEPSGDG